MECQAICVTLKSHKTVAEHTETQGAPTEVADFM